MLVSGLDMESFSTEKVILELSSKIKAERQNLEVPMIKTCTTL